MFPSKKKKKMQVSSPGRATPAPNYKNDERGDVFCIQKLLFPPFKSHTHGIDEFVALGSSFFAFFDSVLRLCSSPTSKCSIPKLSKLFIGVF